MIHEAKKLIGAKQSTLSHEQRVTSIGWNCEADVLASGSSDGSIKLWKMDSRQLFRELSGLKAHDARVEKICWDPTNSSVLASASEDKKIKLWDTRTGRCTNSCDTTAEPLSFAISPDGKYYASGDKNDQITLFDSRTMTSISTFKPEKGAMANEISWNKPGSHLFVSCGYSNNNVGGTFLILDTKSGKMENVREIKAHTSNCMPIHFDSQDSKFALGSYDSMVSIWDAHQLVCLRTLTRSDSSIRAVAFNHDGSAVAYASSDAFLFIDDANTGESIAAIDSSFVDQVSCISWNPRHNVLAYAGDEPKGTRGGFVRLCTANS